MKIRHPCPQFTLQELCYPPGQLRIIRSIQQHKTGITDEPISPGADHHRAHNADERIKEVNLPEIAGPKGKEGKGAGCSIGEHMDIGRAYIVIVIMIMMMIMIRGMCMLMLMGLVQDGG